MREAEGKRAVEAMLFAAEGPMTTQQIAAVLPDATLTFVENILRELEIEYRSEHRAFEIQRIAGGVQIVTCPDVARWVEKLHRSGTRPRLSKPALETLAIIAYKQPVGRSELEAIRGVSVDAVLRTLLERGMIEVAGRGEGLGRPLLYRTTIYFLEYFGLPSLEALPRTEELAVLFDDRERQEELRLEAAEPDAISD